MGIKGDWDEKGSKDHVLFGTVSPKEKINYLRDVRRNVMSKRK